MYITISVDTELSISRSLQLNKIYLKLFINNYNKRRTFRRSCRYLVCNKILKRNLMAKVTKAFLLCVHLISVKGRQTNATWYIVWLLKFGDNSALLAVTTPPPPSWRHHNLLTKRKTGLKTLEQGGKTHCLMYLWLEKQANRNNCLFIILQYIQNCFQKFFYY